MMQFNAYQEPNQRPSQNFVNPSMLNAGQSNYLNGNPTRILSLLLITDLKQATTPSLVNALCNLRHISRRLVLPLILAHYRDNKCCSPPRVKLFHQRTEQHPRVCWYLSRPLLALTSCRNVQSDQARSCCQTESSERSQCAEET